MWRPLSCSVRPEWWPYLKILTERRVLYHNLAIAVKGVCEKILKNFQNPRRIRKKTALEEQGRLFGNQGRCQRLTTTLPTIGNRILNRRQLNSQPLTNALSSVDNRILNRWRFDSQPLTTPCLPNMYHLTSAILLLRRLKVWLPYPTPCRVHQ